MSNLTCTICDKVICNHQTGFAQILIPLSGCLHLRLADGEHTLYPNQLCFIPAHMERYGRAEKQMIAICITEIMIKPQDRCRLKKFLTFPIDQHIAPLVELIRREIMHHIDSDSIKYLYFYLYRRIIEKRSDAALEIKSRRYIDEHFDEPLTINQLASMENYNPAYFNQWFKSLVGMPPIQYLRHVRISWAKELLATTDAEIIDIGLQVGYNSHSSFARAFRKVTGCTPNEFRLCVCPPDNSQPQLRQA